jgi:DNA-binding NarL/FixJ family response regulator
MTRIALVDDSERFLANASELLRGDGFDVVGVATCTASALALVERTRPDAVLVDIGLGAENGLDLAARLCRGAEPPAVVVVSGYEYEDFAELIEASGAAGFVPKTTLSGPAVREVLVRAGSGV